MEPSRSARRHMQILDTLEGRVANEVVRLDKLGVVRPHVLMRSPDGTVWALHVDDDGLLYTTRFTEVLEAVDRLRQPPEVVEMLENRDTDRGIAAGMAARSHSSQSLADLGEDPGADPAD